MYISRIGEYMRFDAVLFDLDGTLANTLQDLALSVNYVLKNEGYPTHPIDAYKYFAGDGILKMIERALPAEKRSHQLISNLKDKFLEYYSVHYADFTTAYDGLISLIKALKSKGVKLAVVTNKAQDMAGTIVVVQGAITNIQHLVEFFFYLLSYFFFFL